MGDLSLYWGDLHNHNELGYGLGSLGRSYEIARSHLNFYNFTPHAQYADGRASEGYEIVNAHWGDIQKAAAEQNDPGAFTTFLGYEWHSSAWGHVHVVCFEDYQPLHFAPTLADLQDFYRGRQAILVPHHIGYVNGVDWELFDGALSPVVEIFSEHGCSERDFGPFPMVGHSGGPGPGRFTAQSGLAMGRRFGFVAGWDAIRQVALVRNNVPVHVRAPDCAQPAGGGRFRLRLEWGWGPMKGYQVFDWEGCVTVEDGALRRVAPCFVSDPFDEHRRKRVLEQDEAHCRWQSHTSRGGIFNTRNSMPACSANDALCLEVEGDGATRVRLEVRCGTRQSILATGADWSIANATSEQAREYRLGDLLVESDGFRMGDAPGSFRVHRAVPAPLYALSGEYRHPEGGPAYYYLRVTQENGQMAWSSPIWFE